MPAGISTGHGGGEEEYPPGKTLMAQDGAESITGLQVFSVAGGSPVEWGVRTGGQPREVSGAR